MRKTTISRNIVCSLCGSATFEVPPDATWATAVICSHCRKDVGPLGDLRDQLMGRPDKGRLNATDFMIMPIDWRSPRRRG
jgi:hypothetical protein